MRRLNDMCDVQRLREHPACGAAAAYLAVNSRLRSRRARADSAASVARSWRARRRTSRKCSCPSGRRNNANATLMPRCRQGRPEALEGFADAVSRYQNVVHIETSRPSTFPRLTLPPLADAADCRSLTNESAMRHGTHVDVIEVLIAMPFAMRMKPRVMIVSMHG